MSSIRFYPILNSNHIKMINLDTSSNHLLEFFDEIPRNIAVKRTKDVTILSDQNHKWAPEKHNLIFRKKITLNPSKLFGRNGIAPKGSIIGVATIYTSSKSLQTRVDYNDVLYETDETVEVELSYTAFPNELRNDFKIESFFYLKESASVLLDGEENLNNEMGVRLGVIFEHRFILSGDGSTFPTKVVSEKNGPLWWLATGYYLDDNIQDAVVLYINKSHPKYACFDYRDKANYSPELIEEIYINILFQLINKHVNELQEINFDDLPVNSLGLYLKFFIDAFELDLSNTDRIYYEISRRMRRK